MPSSGRYERDAQLAQLSRESLEGELLRLTASAQERQGQLMAQLEEGAQQREELQQQLRSQEQQHAQAEQQLQQQLQQEQEQGRRLQAEVEAATARARARRGGNRSGDSDTSLPSDSAEEGGSRRRRRRRGREGHSKSRRRSSCEQCEGQAATLSSVRRHLPQLQAALLSARQGAAEVEDVKQVACCPAPPLAAELPWSCHRCPLTLLT